jgi:beta-lactam-binding protein with PASTA domain
MKLVIKKIYTYAAEISYLFPFLAFCIGYLCLQFFITETVVQTPDLIGKDILQATKICSDLKLNLRIIAEKEINDAVPGTIIKQNPLQQTLIKAHQSIFIVVTKLADPIIAPTLIGKNMPQIEEICAKQKIKHRAYFLPSNVPAGQCFAQMPSELQILPAKKISSYISTGHENQYLFPDFSNIPLHEVLHFLQEKNISYDVFYKDQKLSAPYKKNYVVSYQKPLAGSLISLNNKLYVQLQVV